MKKNFKVSKLFLTLLSVLIPGICNTCALVPCRIFSKGRKTDYKYLGLVFASLHHGKLSKYYFSQ